MHAASVREQLRGFAGTALLERLDPPLEAEPDAPLEEGLGGARFRCYQILGFSWEQALQLALAPEATVAAAVRLVERDCPHETAVAILV